MWEPKEEILKMEEFTAYLYTNENDPVKRIKWITVKRKEKKIIARVTLLSG